MRLLLRCDGGPAIGVGHVVRSLAIAEEALSRGHEVSILGSLQGALLAGLVGDIGSSGQAVTILGAASPGEIDPRVTSRFDAVHVDHYETGTRALATLDDFSERTEVSRPVLSVMADGVFGAQPADVLIDPTVGAEAADPPAEATWHLRGGRFSPIRRAVTQAQHRDAPSGSPLRVLVVMGGTDPLGCAPAVVAGLALIDVPMRVTVVTSPGTVDALESARERWPHGSLRLTPPVADLPAAMARSDLVITAAGTSVWELCCLHRPMAVVAVVDNQRVGYDVVVGRGAALGLGGPAHLADPSVLASRLRPLVTDPNERQRHGAAAHRLVDGLGAWRLVTMIERAVSARSEGSISLSDGVAGSRVDVREATIADAEILLAWRNDPATRAASRQPDVVEPDDHRAWLESSLDRADRHLLIGSVSGVLIGTVRWDAEPDEEWEVSITLDPEARGRRLAGPLLRGGQDWLAGRSHPVTVLAVVHRDNPASAKLFLREGYAPDLPPDEAGFERYVRTL